MKASIIWRSEEIEARRRMMLYESLLAWLLARQNRAGHLGESRDEIATSSQQPRRASGSGRLADDVLARSCASPS